jgi:hypothetical protein
MSDGDDTVKIGLAKLQLRPGDLLCVSVPDSWTGADVAAFEAALRADFSLDDIAILVIPETAQIFVRHRREPSGAAALRQMPPATKAVN